MTTRNTRPVVVLLEGDGIGPTVIRAARRVLDAVGFAADYISADIGWRCWEEAGNALPEATLNLLRQHGVGLLGAITSKSKAEAEAALPVHLKGREYRSPILELRGRLDLRANIRPFRSFANHPRAFVRRRVDGEIETPTIDAMICYENTEGLYAGVEFDGPDGELWQALAKHARLAGVDPSELTTALHIVTRTKSRELLGIAAELARKRGDSRLIVCEKAGVTPSVSARFMQDLESEVGSDLDYEVVNADTLLMRLCTRPDSIGVVATTSLYGDMISDALAGLTGGLGFAHSENRGSDCSVFEPVHGSAPRLCQFDPAIANPSAAILASALMLEHLNESQKARRIRGAVEQAAAQLFETTEAATAAILAFIAKDS